MVRFAHERILLIGDISREVQSALAQAAPGAQITAVTGMFDAIAELSGGDYTTVLAAAEPIERRPEAAVRTLRELAGDSRLPLFGHPTLEPLSRRMLDFGCDDYVVAPPSPAELQQVFGTPRLRLAEPDAESSESDAPPAEIIVADPPSPIASLPLADILLDGLLQHPADSPAAVVRQINQRLSPMMQLHLQPTPDAPPSAGDDQQLISHPVRTQGDTDSTLHLLVPAGYDQTAARHFLAHLSALLAKVAGLQDRHNRLQKLAITDELTGLYNARYFRHFLNRIVEKARSMRFPVTLLLFDIDNFKRYNDEFGHAVGDEILKQTAALMKRVCRDHDLVARISGDEFAVVFWEKEGPRQPREPQATPPSRVPQTIMPILNRFRRLLQSQDFSELGPTGRGCLTISGGLAVYPYDAANVPDLIKAADQALMFGAKTSGKNRIQIVGDDHCFPERPPTA